jgi:hypothetical protein
MPRRGRRKPATSWPRNVRSAQAREAAVPEVRPMTERYRFEEHAEPGARRGHGERGGPDEYNYERRAR